jgi:demethylmenaquinone methyltransferase / 2-methoxy-6-polyprenyl-1,4-benzoquinol methylase
VSLSVPAKDASRISGMFDAIAGRYDLLNGVLSAGLDKRWRARAIDSLNLTGRETILDLCTGTADLALAAATGARRAKRIIGVDFAGAMLALGQEKVRRTDPSWPAEADGRRRPGHLARTEPGAGPAIDLVRGDAVQLPLADASVDAVTIGFGIRNVEQPAVACREIARVLRPGGKLVILEFSLPRTAVVRSFYLWYFRRVLPLIGRAISHHPSAYTYLPASVEAFPSPEAFVQELRENGFSTVEAVPLTLGVVYMFTAVKGVAGATSA